MGVQATSFLALYSILEPRKVREGVGRSSCHCWDALSPPIPEHMHPYIFDAPAHGRAHRVPHFQTAIGACLLHYAHTIHPHSISPHFGAAPRLNLLA